MKIILCLLCSLFPFILYADFSDKNVKCDYYIEDKDEFAEILLLGGEYSNKDATGILCSEDGFIGTSIKNGKSTGDVIIREYYDKKNKHIKMEVYLNGFDNILASIIYLAIVSGEYIENMDDIRDIMKSLQLKKGKVIFKKYYKSGKIGLKEEYIINKRKITGTRNIYDDNGALVMRVDTTVNGVMDGNAEIYTDSGRLFGKLVYEKGKIVYGECANERRHGKKWTAAEISNWENGLDVDCGYF